MNTQELPCGVVGDQIILCGDKEHIKTFKAPPTTRSKGAAHRRGPSMNHHNYYTGRREYAAPPTKSTTFLVILLEKISTHPHVHVHGMLFDSTHNSDVAGPP